MQPVAASALATLDMGTGSSGRGGGGGAEPCWATSSGRLTLGVDSQRRQPFTSLHLHLLGPREGPTGRTCSPASRTAGVLGSGLDVAPDGTLRRKRDGRREFAEEALPQSIPAYYLHSPPVLDVLLPSCSSVDGG